MPLPSSSAKLSALCQCLKPFSLNGGISCGGMWENIPPVQLHGSTIYAKSRLSSSGGSQWPGAQLRHLVLMFPSFQLHLFPTLSHLSPYLLPPSSPCLPCGRTIWELAYLCICVCVYVCVLPLLLQWAGADACVNKLWAGMKMCKVL